MMPTWEQICSIFPAPYNTIRVRQPVYYIVMDQSKPCTSCGGTHQDTIIIDGSPYRSPDKKCQDCRITWMYKEDVIQQVDYIGECKHEFTGEVTKPYIRIWTLNNSYFEIPNSDDFFITKEEAESKLLEMNQ